MQHSGSDPFLTKTDSIFASADTTAAVCGQIAGAYYGVEGIPEDWISALCMTTEIAQMAVELFQLQP